MRTTARFLLAVVCFGSLLVPARADALDVRLEIAPSAAIPLSALMDGVPIQESLDPNLGFGSSVIYRLDFEQQVGFGVSLALLLNDWEIRYDFARYAYKRVKITHLRFPDTTNVMYWPLADFNEFLIQAGGTPLPSSVSLTDWDALYYHCIGFGYRFTPFDWVVHPYVPLDIGFALIQPGNDFELMYGFYIQSGLGLNWDATDHLRVGLVARFTFGFFKNPDTSTKGISDLGIQAGVTNNSSFEAVLETFRTVNVAAHISYKF